MNNNFANNISKRLTELTGAVFETADDSIRLSERNTTVQRYTASVLLFDFGIIINPEINAKNVISVESINGNLVAGLDNAISEHEPKRRRNLDESIELLKNITGVEFVFDENKKVLMINRPHEYDANKLNALIGNEVISSCQFKNGKNNPLIVYRVDLDKLKAINLAMERAARQITGKWVQKLEQPFVDFKRYKSR